MKKLLLILAGLFAFGAACVSLLILAAIAVTMTRARVGPEPSPGPGPAPSPSSRPWTPPTPRPEPTPDMTRYLRNPGEVRQFAREDGGASYKLGFGFIDYAGNRHVVTCKVDKAD